MTPPIVSTRSLVPPDLKTNTPGRQPAVFIDCDGVLVDDFIREPERLSDQLRPDSLQALAKLNRFLPQARVVLVSNQRWVRSSPERHQQAVELFDAVNSHVNQAGGDLDAIHFAPTNGVYREQPDHVSGRKPDPGMFFHAAREMGNSIDLADSYMVGDMTTDMEAAQKAHPDLCKVLVETGHGGRDGKSEVLPDRRCANLAQAVDWIIARETVAELFDPSPGF